MVRTVFMGTPEFAVPCLEALIETQQVVGVVTQPDRLAGRGRQLRPSPVKIAALDANLPIFQPDSLKKEVDAAQIRSWAPELIVVVAFGQILRSHVLDLPQYSCINVHASLLPRWRGASPIQHAILAGDAETGVTLMQMDVGLDTGPMFVKATTPVEPQETAASLHDKLAGLGAMLLRDKLGDIVNGRIPATPQDDSLSTYAPLIKKSEGEIDWDQSCETIDRQIRAMTPWPGARTSWKNKPLKVIEASPTPINTSQKQPGQVFSEGETAVVCTGTQGLQLNRIQLSGKKAMQINDFLRGHPEFIGATLGNKL
ncbi:MAG: methionyl-tRNA formyltransferase [Chloroflexota bacterium]